MAHISSIGAGLHSALAVTASAVAIANRPANEAAWEALFADDANFERFPNIREFPQIGTPANIVNVPVYGQKTSSQIQGQADAPTLELTINYVPDELATSGIAAKVGDGNVYAFQFSLLNASPTGAPGKEQLQAVSGNLGSVLNSNFYFQGKIEALLVSPQLTDANQATLTLSAIGDFVGPFTVAPA